MTCLPNFIRNGFSFHSPRYISLFFVPPISHISPLLINTNKQTNKTTSSIINHQEPLINLFNQSHHVSSLYPSAIALGTIFNHAASLAVLGPVFGETYHRAQAANSKEEFVKSKEAASAAAAWGTSLVGSAVQSYGVGALINATGTLSYKGAAYLGSLIFMASSAPSFIAQVTTEKRPLDTVAVGALARVFETVGLSLFLTWWGTHTNPFE
ncbi:uncharacterized protein EAF02_005985 [Botrytis sinoallii]|uniref:uncharacterized protein n=1 Tax=Botrytis sinoallii TaxID=1463999 RepID=UPI001901BC44|nr:uncharacterized protein EAF02_005985 [Botrytis sinoallii]KAF7882622.1 hypothetical protein EAF02_005985 [Botrytis sinoallii]